MSQPAKTAKKTARSPINGAEIPLGNHPGNTGGKKGRSGRKSDIFMERARALCNNPVVWDVAERFAEAGNLKPLEFAASYTYGKPKEHTEVSGELIIRIVKEGKRRAGA